MTVTSKLFQRSRSRARRWLGLFGASLVAMTLTAGAATATIVERDRSIKTPYEFTAWDCGYPMQVTGVSTDLIHVRADNRNPDNSFFTDNYAVTETWTGPDGRFFTLSANGQFKNVQAHQIDGSLYQFENHETGQPFVITDSRGKVIYRDRGNLVTNYTYDFETGEGNFLGNQLHGPHPMFFLDLCLAVGPLVAPFDSAKHLTERPIGSTSFPNGYDEYLPPSYSATGAKSPLLLFFNGAGENGDGTPEAIDKLLLAGIPKYINVGGWDTARPFVVLAMQHVEEPGFDFSPCADVDPWGGSCGMQLTHDRGNVQPAPCTLPDEVRDFIDYALANYNVDPSRVYITGHSCGGYGVWEYLAKYGADRKVAAAVPMAGDGRPGNRADYCALGATPLWAFHGALDDVVDPQGSIEPMTALQACPGVAADRARLTVFPDSHHADSRDPAYGGAAGDIYEWMLGFTSP
jgi:hypothetical protein